jgi:hypothetical protein
MALFERPSAIKAEDFPLAVGEAPERIVALRRAARARPAIGARGARVDVP